MNKSECGTGSWIFVSNMYPSEQDPSYGAFIQRIRTNLASEGLKIAADVLICGRKSGLNKVKAYLFHHFYLAKLLACCKLSNWYINYASHHCIVPAIAALFFKKNVFVNIHGDDIVLKSTTWYRSIMALGQRQLLENARIIIVPSFYFKEIVTEIYPKIDSSRIIVSGSGGVDYDGLSGVTAGKLAFWNSSHETRIAKFGYVGRIDSDKGWDKLFEAFLNLPENLKEHAQLHFWGEGTERSLLIKRINTQGEGRVFYHGSVAASQLPAVHAHFDFKVVPSLRESLGLAAVEGLAAGQILICSAIRPFTDITKDGVSALHFIPGSAGDLGRVMAEALQAPDQVLEQLACVGQNIGRAFDQKLVAANLISTIDKANS